MTQVQTAPKTKTIDITDFLDGGIIRESSFREKINQTDWKSYLDLKVVIKGCDTVPVPTWAYLSIVANLAPFASHLFWGEPCSAILVYKRKRVG